MTIRTRLNVSIIASLILVILIAAIFYSTTRRVGAALDAVHLSGDIVNAIFEKNILMTDYLRNDSDRARAQWLSKHDHLRKLLDKAFSAFAFSGENDLVREMIAEHENESLIFSRIVSNRRAMRKGPPAFVSEVETRLVSQLLLRSIEGVSTARSLDSAADKGLSEALRSSEWTALGLLVVIGGILTINFWTLGRIVSRRIEGLLKGTSIIGAGSLDYNIEIKGNDELTDLTRAFNAMTGRVRQFNAALRESEERLRLIAETIAEVFWMADVSSGKILYVSPAYEAIWKRSVQSLYENPGSFHQSIHPEDLDNSLAVFETMKSGLPLNHEYRIVRPDGSIRWILNRGFPVRDESGHISRYVGIALDITERKNAEEALKRLSQRNELILNAAGEGIYGTDVKGNITFANPAAAEMLGFRIEELISKKSHYLFHHTKPDGKPYPLEECPLQKSLAEGKVHRGEKEFFWTRDGSMIHVEHVNTPLVESGGVIGAVVVFKDITERRKVEETTRLAGAYHRSLIEASLDPLVTIGPDGKITDVNSSTERATGYSREKLIGTDFSDYFTEPDTARAGYQRVFREGMVKDYALEIRHRDGRTTAVLYNASVYKNEKGKIIGVFAAARDITERKRMEEDLRRINEELDLRVKERTSELEEKIAEIENLNKLFVGRELRMVELKEKIREMEKEKHGG